MEIKRICFFGIYDPGYGRNRVLIEGLKANGVEVIECNSRISGIHKYIDLVRKHWKIRNQYDVLLVAFPGYQAAILASLITRKRIVFDAFFSISQAKIEDRKVLSKYSPRAWYYVFLDWFSCTVANRVLLDTNANIAYFVRTFNLSAKKFIRVFVGTDPQIFYPRPRTPTDEFIIHFHGHFIPLQGVEYIVRAADILRDEGIIFQIVGSGQEYQRIRRLADTMSLTNIRWIPRVLYADLPDYISKADACLGGFGNTEKTKLVIMNKIFEYAACARPIITANTLAIAELFSDRENILLCRAADPVDLAKAIIILRDDRVMGEMLGKNARDLFQKKCTPHIIGQQLITQMGAMGGNH